MQYYSQPTEMRYAVTHASMVASCALCSLLMFEQPTAVQATRSLRSLNTDRASGRVSQLVQTVYLLRHCGGHAQRIALSDSNTVNKSV